MVRVMNLQRMAKGPWTPISSAEVEIQTKEGIHSARKIARECNSALVILRGGCIIFTGNSTV